ncbi:YdeI/OmpD-associated family protein [Trujillonella humicola]|uniref:YdeI/OmpD-associated family protein n=1 Tax=Trujillonella humicola TaxID=3383699 RepID=UPI003905E46C
MPDAPRVHAADRAAWRAWLAQHAADSSGIWLVYDKGRGRRLSYDDIVEEALCFGWVDSLPRAVDDTRAMLYVAPRKPRSNWSRVNKERVQRLIAAGAMSEAGSAVVEAAKASGAWNALDRVEDGDEPDDLAAALDAAPAARREWNAFPRSVRRAILEWVGNAKRPQTRARRVATVVAEAREGRRANQWRQPAGRRRPAGAAAEHDR